MIHLMFRHGLNKLNQNSLCRRCVMELKTHIFVYCNHEDEFSTLFGCLVVCLILWVFVLFYFLLPINLEPCSSFSFSMPPCSYTNFSFQYWSVDKQHVFTIASVAISLNSNKVRLYSQFEGNQWAKNLFRLWIDLPMKTVNVLVLANELEIPTIGIHNFGCYLI